MTYAEAVKQMEYVLYQASRTNLGPESKQTGEEALAVLKRAVPVMGAVEKCDTEDLGEDTWLIEDDPCKAILRECLTYKKGE